MVVGPDFQGQGDSGEDDRSVTNLVEQPAKVMRIGSMIRQLLEEVRAAPLDEASRKRLKEIHESSIKELEDGLAPELVDELERLSLPFTDENGTPPSEAELRIAHACWSDGSKVSSTASRPRCSRSRWPPARSWSRCAGRCPVCRRATTAAPSALTAVPAPTCSPRRGGYA